MSPTRHSYAWSQLFSLSDKFKGLRSGRARMARRCCVAALLTTVGPLGIMACGGSSHAPGTSAANVSAAQATGTSATLTTATTSTASGASGAHNGTPGTAASKAGRGHSHGSGGAGGTAAGGAVRHRASAPQNHRAGSGGHGGGTHHHGRTVRRVVTGSAIAGAGTAVPTGTGTSSGSGAPNANTGVPYEVHTTSMEPNFQGETMVYYDPTKTHPQIGDVVLFYLPTGSEGGSCGEVMTGGRPCRDPVPGLTKTVSIKRVVGLPGDSIAVRAGQVIRNGQPESGPPTEPCGKDERQGCEFPNAITVPAGHYYLMADNRGLFSEDSRIFGAVPQEAILGTVEGR